MRFLRHLKNNEGDENISKMIWITIIFMASAFILLFISNAFQAYVGPYFNNITEGWFNYHHKGYQVSNILVK